MKERMDEFTAFVESQKDLSQQDVRNMCLGIIMHMLTSLVNQEQWNQAMQFIKDNTHES